MGKNDFYKLLVEKMLEFIFDIIKDMVPAMPLGFELVTLTILMYFSFLIELYNKFQKS